MRQDTRLGTTAKNHAVSSFCLGALEAVGLRIEHVDGPHRAAIDRSCETPTHFRTAIGVAVPTGITVNSLGGKENRQLRSRTCVNSSHSPLHAKVRHREARPGLAVGSEPRVLLLNRVLVVT
jgi:hypothetical protein